MRFSALVVLIALPGAVVAQHAGVINPSRGMQTPAGAWRYGNILYPGGVPAHQNSHAGRLGGTIAGNPPYTGVRPGFPSGGRPRTVVVPYAYPVFMGGGYYGGYAEPPHSTNVTVVVPQQPAPQVIINNSYVPETANPVVREYSQGEPSESSSGIRVYEGSQARTTTPPPQKGPSIMDEKATIYLIALTDGTVRQAIGYWQQGDTFHYITPDSTINHLSLAMVDRDRSIQLNSERKLEFDIRPPR